MPSNSYPPPPDQWQRTLPVSDAADAEEIEALLSLLSTYVTESDAENLNHLRGCVRRGRVASLTLNVGSELPDSLTLIVEVAPGDKSMDEALSTIGSVFGPTGEWADIQTALHERLAAFEEESSVQFGFSYRLLQRDESQARAIRRDAFTGSPWDRVELLSDRLAETCLFTPTEALCLVACELYGFASSDVAHRCGWTETAVDAARDRGWETGEAARTVVELLRQSGRYDTTIRRVVETRPFGPFDDPEAIDFPDYYHTADESLVGQCFVSLEDDEMAFVVDSEAGASSEAGIRGYIGLVISGRNAGEQFAISAAELDSRRVHGTLGTARVRWRGSDYIEAIEETLSAQAAGTLSDETARDAIADVLLDARRTLPDVEYRQLETQLTDEQGLDLAHYR